MEYCKIKIPELAGAGIRMAYSTLTRKDRMSFFTAVALY
jgi:hypothetical protein